MKFFLPLLLLLAVGCTRALPPEPTPEIISDRDYLPAYHLTKRPADPALQEASRRAGKGKPTTSTPTTGTAGWGVALLDFDGHYHTGPSWNMGNPLTLAYSGMSQLDIDSTIARAQKALARWKLHVTTDTTVFYQAPLNARVRAVFTESWEWYGRAGGVAYTNSFTKNEDIPCFIFTSLLGYTYRNVAEAGIHEIGHTLGLRHQSLYDEYGVKQKEYRPSVFMGQSYNEPYGGRWTTGYNSFYQWQDDIAWISRVLPLR